MSGGSLITLPVTGSNNSITGWRAADTTVFFGRATDFAADDFGIEVELVADCCERFASPFVVPDRRKAIDAKTKIIVTITNVRIPRRAPRNRSVSGRHANGGGSGIGGDV